MVQDVCQLMRAGLLLEWRGGGVWGENVTVYCERVSMEKKRGRELCSVSIFLKDNLKRDSLCCSADACIDEYAARIPIQPEGGLLKFADELLYNALTYGSWA